MANWSIQQQHTQLPFYVFVGAKFYCMHALAEGNQCTLIREKTLEFSLTVLPTLSLHLKSWSSSQKNALSVLDLQNVHRKGDAINKYSVSCKRYSNAMLSVVPETSTIQ